MISYSNEVDSEYLENDEVSHIQSLQYQTPCLQPKI